MLKRPGVIFTSIGNVQALSCPHSTCVFTSPSDIQLLNTRTDTRLGSRNKSKRRGFSTTKPGRSSTQSSEDLDWPDLPSATAIPTPYQIFGQKKNGQYSKRRYYELVKLYHPDKHAQEDNLSHQKSYPHAVRLERYRLVVAANDILSDPAKRGAYDRYGAGWNGQPEIGSQKQDWNRAAGTGWSGFHGNDSPAQNATWEDWERWYRRDSKGAQEPLYFSNSAFVSLIVMAAALGSIGQATRVGEYSRTFLEQIEVVHDDCSKDIQRRRRESLGFVNKDERIQSFLKSRDPDGYSIKDPTEQGYRNLPPSPNLSPGSTS